MENAWWVVSIERKLNLWIHRSSLLVRAATCFKSVPACYKSEPSEWSISEWLHSAALEGNLSWFKIEVKWSERAEHSARSLWALQPGFLSWVCSGSLGKELYICTVEIYFLLESLAFFFSLFFLLPTPFFFSFTCVKVELFCGYTPVWKFHVIQLCATWQYSEAGNQGPWCFSQMELSMPMGV